MIIRQEALKTKKIMKSPKDYETEKSRNQKKDHKSKDLEKMIKHEDEKPKDHETKNVETRRSKNQKIMKFENPKERKPKDHVKIISNISKTPKDERQRISCLIFSSCSVCET